MGYISGEYNFTIETGATCERYITYEDEQGTPIDLSQTSMKMQIRDYKTDDSVISELTLNSGIIPIDLVEGQFKIRIEASETETYRFRRAAYDLEITYPDGTVERLIRGKIDTTIDITR